MNNSYLLLRSRHIISHSESHSDGFLDLLVNYGESRQNSYDSKAIHVENLCCQKGGS